MIFLYRWICICGVFLFVSCSLEQQGEPTWVEAVLWNLAFKGFVVPIVSIFWQNDATGNGDGGFYGLARIKLHEILPEDGAASGVYTRAVEKLAVSLARNNAAIIELNPNDAAIVRCALESAKLYFRSRSHTASLWNSSDWLKLSGYLAAPARDMYFYRAGRYSGFHITVRLCACILHLG